MAGVTGRPIVVGAERRTTIAIPAVAPKRGAGLGSEMTVIVATDTQRRMCDATLATSVTDLKDQT